MTLEEMGFSHVSDFDGSDITWHSPPYEVEVAYDQIIMAYRIVITSAMFPGQIYTATAADPKEVQSKCLLGIGTFAMQKPSPTIEECERIQEQLKLETEEWINEQWGKLVSQEPPPSSWRDKPPML